MCREGAGHGGGISPGRRGSVSTTPEVCVSRLKVLDVYLMYPNSSSRPEPPPAWGSLQDWGQSSLPMAGVDWEGGQERQRACLRRGRDLVVRATLTVAPVRSTEIRGQIEARATLNGDGSRLQRQSVAFVIPASADRVDVRFTFGALPDDLVGRFTLGLQFESTSTDYRFGRQAAELRIYAIYDHPLDPAYDSDDLRDDGGVARNEQSTISGTPRRMDHLMEIIGGPRRVRSVPDQAAINALIWDLHRRINDHNPPYFDGGHDVYITHNGDGDGRDYALSQQWLMWASSPPRPGAVDQHDLYWNDASCIGHVQLLKTMAAAMGIFTRRSWVYPSTDRMPRYGSARARWRGRDLPRGGTVSVGADDIYSLGRQRDDDVQRWQFDADQPECPLPPPPGLPSGAERVERYVTAKPVLMEPPDAGGASWENFEACLISPEGRFLPGGYTTRSIGSTARNFAENRGFEDALELLRWWTTTERPDFGRRFMLWKADQSYRVQWGDHVTTYTYARLFDRDGCPVDVTNYATARDQGRELHVP
jgi:hypothetical protein